MERDRDILAIGRALERCRQLAKDFPDGPTAQHIRELQAGLTAELTAALRAPKKQWVPEWISRPVDLAECPTLLFLVCEEGGLPTMSPTARYWTLHWIRVLLWPLPVLTLLRAGRGALHRLKG